MIARTAFRTAFPASAAIWLLVGCAHIPNQWAEDGPAASADLESPTAQDLRANYSPAEQRCRDWETVRVVADRGAVTHWPLYFEDPFADKGHGRKGPNKYHIGWEDYIALPYCYARFTLNWLMLPASAIVTPAFIVMESDGELSKQALGYDHDACRHDSTQAATDSSAEIEEEPVSEEAESAT